MKSLVLLTALLCSAAIMKVPAQSLPDFDQFPHVVLNNGTVKMKVYLPDKEKGLYRATRFDWSGVIGSVQYKGHEYFGYWKSTHDPYFHEDLMGPVEGFIEPGLGYEEAAPGGHFIRIGVGVLKKEDEPEYDWMKTYEIVDHGRWKVDHGEDWITFSHHLETDFGYSYIYRKSIRLKADGFLIDHTLENTGRKLIETDQFNHNFFMIDGEPSGPAFKISFPFEPQTNDDPKGFARIEGKDLLFTREVWDDAFFLLLEGYSQELEDHRVKVLNQKSGAGVSFTVDKPLHRMAFWACGTTLSPENSVWISAAPGESDRWTSDYTLFSTHDAPPIPAFLEGNWKAGETGLFEQWTRLNEGSMKGISYGYDPGGMKVIEFMEIEKNDRALVLSAAVPGQNRGEEIDFRCIRSDSVYEFVNPEHDFPQLIRYSRISGSQLEVFAGTTGDGYRMEYERLEPARAAGTAGTSAKSRVDTMPSGEILLVQEIEIRRPVERVWKAFTTPEDWKKWVTPVVEMDFRVGGSIRSHYNPEAKIGDEGTIVIHITNFIPMEQITMQSELTENFPEFVKEEEKNLFSVFKFEPVSPASTRVTLYGIGYKNESRWQELLQFFIQGNEMTLNNLQKYLHAETD